MASFGLLGLGGGCTWAKAELLIISATHAAPAAIVKCPIHSSRGCAPVIPALLSSAPPDHPAHILTGVFPYGSGGSDVTITRESFAWQRPEYYIDCFEREGGKVIRTPRWRSVSPFRPRCLGV